MDRHLNVAARVLQRNHLPRPERIAAHLRADLQRSPNRFLFNHIRLHLIPRHMPVSRRPHVFPDRHSRHRVPRKQLCRHVGQEPRGRVVPAPPLIRAPECMHQVQLPLRPRDPHVQQPPLFLNRIRVVHRQLVRHQVLFHPNQEHAGKLESLCLMQRDQGQRIRPSLRQIIDIRNQCDVLQEDVQRRPRRNGVVVLRDADQLLDVLPAILRLRLIRCQPPQMVAVVRPIKQQPHRLRQGLRRRHSPCIPHQVHEPAQVRRRPRGDAGWIEGTDRILIPPRCCCCRIKRRARMLLRPIRQHCRRLRPDPARRHVHDPVERRRISRVPRQPQVGDQVAHLAPVIEPRVPDDPARNAPIIQRLLDGPRLRIRPVQHCRIRRPQRAVPHALLQPPHHVLRLIHLVIGLMHRRQRPPFPHRPQPPRQPLPRPLHHRIRHFQNRPV